MIYEFEYNEELQEYPYLFKVEKNQYVNKAFRINKNLSDRLTKAASEEKVSANDLAAQCCEYSLDNRDSKAGKEQPVQYIIVMNKPE